MRWRSSGRRRVLAIVVALCAAGWPAFARAASAQGCGGDVAAADAHRTAADTSRALLCLINTERRLRGLQGLAPSLPLCRAAQRHAEDMAALRYFSHVAPDGSTFGDRIRKAGYLKGLVTWDLGEAIGRATVRRRFTTRIRDSLMASPEHRRLLLHPAFDDVGIGIVVAGPAAASRRAKATVVIALGHAVRRR